MYVNYNYKALSIYLHVKDLEYRIRINRGKEEIKSDPEFINVDEHNILLDVLNNELKTNDRVVKMDFSQSHTGLTNAISYELFAVVETRKIIKNGTTLQD